MQIGITKRSALMVVNLPWHSVTAREAECDGIKMKYENLLPSLTECN